MRFRNLLLEAESLCLTSIFNEAKQGGGYVSATEQHLFTTGPRPVIVGCAICGLTRHIWSGSSIKQLLSSVQPYHGSVVGFLAMLQPSIRAYQHMFLSIRHWQRSLWMVPYSADQGRNDRYQA